MSTSCEVSIVRFNHLACPGCEPFFFLIQPWLRRTRRQVSWTSSGTPTHKHREISCLTRCSTIAPDDIPFKLRCAICSKLAVNAFRLPCCDQSICETCKHDPSFAPSHALITNTSFSPGQASLTDTCPVCAHTPVSPDLCKPNKALRTTLKAFLRTEEKKREKDRQATAPPTPTTAAPTPAPAENDSAPVEAPTDQQPANVTPMQISEPTPMPETKPSEAAAGVEGNNAELGAPEPVESEAQVRIYL